MVDWDAMWHIAVAVAIVGIGAPALLGAAMEATARLREGGRGGAAVLDAGIVALAGVAAVAALVVGVIAMTHK